MAHADMVLYRPDETGIGVASVVRRLREALDARSLRWMGFGRRGDGQKASRHVILADAIGKTAKKRMWR